MSSNLGSWTRTLNEDDAVLLLENSRPGTSRADWLAHGDDILPQASRPRRRETLKIVCERLIDWDHDAIVESRFLLLFQDGHAHRRRTLLYGRLLATETWILRALGQLVHPQLAHADQPLAPVDVDLLPAEVWNDFIRRQLSAEIPAEAFKKTRSTLQRNLAALGVLRVEGNTTRTTRVQHGEPDPIGFGWLLAHEMRHTGRTEAAQTWARTDALPTRLFAARPHYADACIDAAVDAGLLRRGYLAGMARLHPVEAAA